MTKNELLEKFAIYMVSINCNDPIIYRIMGDIIERDGLVYCSAQRMEKLYGDARHMSNWSRARLDDAYRKATHTCWPTPHELEVRAHREKSMQADYLKYSALGYNTD